MITSVENAVWEWLSSASGLPVIFENRNGVRPKTSFVSVYCTGFVTPHPTATGLSVLADGNSSIVSHREYLFKATVRGNSKDLSQRSLSIAEFVVESSETESVIDSFDLLDMALVKVSSPSQYPNVVSTAKIEDDSYFTFTVRVARVFTENIGTIESVQIGGIIIDEQREKILPVFDVN